MLSPQQARAHYDQLGSGQDRELRYAAPVFDWISTHVATEGLIAELGCGTGVLARQIAATNPAASYLGFDISRTMVMLTADRLRAAKAAGHAIQTDLNIAIPIRDGAVSVVIATYLFDLLSTKGQTALLTEAQRVLKPGGDLIICTMIPGGDPLQALRSHFWTMVHAIAPHRVGGCRPVSLKARLGAAGWQVQKAVNFQASGIRSEVLIATPAH